MILRFLGQSGDLQRQCRGHVCLAMSLLAVGPVVATGPSRPSPKSRPWPSGSLSCGASSCVVLGSKPSPSWFPEGPRHSPCPSEGSCWGTEPTPGPGLCARGSSTAGFRPFLGVLVRRRHRARGAAAKGRGDSSALWGSWECAGRTSWWRTAPPTRPEALLLPGRPGPLGRWRGEAEACSEQPQTCPRTPEAPKT